MAARRARSSSADRRPDRDSDRDPHAEKRPPKKPRDFALERLGRRAHSAFELARKMERAGYLENEIHLTLDYLFERKYLDDAAFAKDYARSAADHKKWGPLRIERALRERGVADSLIERALETAFPGDEHDRASEALSRFLGRQKPGRPVQTLKARAYRHLLARGYSPQIAHELVSEENFEDTDMLD